jgi:hypothetical protein
MGQNLLSWSGLMTVEVRLLRNQVLAHRHRLCLHGRMEVLHAGSLNLCLPEPVGQFEGMG